MKHHPLLAGLCAALLIIASAAFTGCASSDATRTPASASAQIAERHLVKVGINGMVCNFCATNLDKTFEKTPGVEKVYVNLAASAVLLCVADAGSPDDTVIRKAVDDAGFAVRSIERTTGDFDAVRDALKESAKVTTW